MSRKNAREDAFKLIFAAEINREEMDQQLEDYLSEENRNDEKKFVNRPTEADNDYLKAVATGVCAKAEELDETIKKHLKNWDVTRLNGVCKAVLRLAVYEIKYVDDVPESVAINEAVELAKKYDTPDTGSFVNGVLGSLVGEK